MTQKCSPCSQDYGDILKFNIETKLRELREFQISPKLSFFKELLLKTRVSRNRHFGKFESWNVDNFFVF